MREIKFRAWDKLNPGMLSNDSLHTFFVGFNGEPGYVNESGSVIFNDENGFVADQLILMQYTGLKDKNGKEIYEGDILSMSESDVHVVSGSAIETTNRIVAWKEEDVSWNIRQMDGEWQSGGYTFCLNNAKKLWEVIGNIYKNPELLSPKN